MTTTTDTATAQSQLDRRLEIEPITDEDLESSRALRAETEALLARGPQLSPVAGEAYRILRDRYPATGRDELLEMLTGAELEHELEEEMGDRHDCLICEAIADLRAIDLLHPVQEGG